VSLHSLPTTVQCPNINQSFSWPKTMYTDHGHQIGQRLWHETLEELEFAGVKEIEASQREPVNSFT
jgi:hypothetical protein